MKTIKAFILGLYEFRSDYTSSPGDDFISAYDWGRETAHRLTFRRFEPS